MTRRPRADDGADDGLVQRAFGIGAAVGFIDGFLFLVFPTLAAILVAMIMFAPPRPAVASGVLTGFGIGMAVPLGLASARCASDSGCMGPDLTGWLAVSALSVLAGLALALIARGRARRSDH